MCGPAFLTRVARLRNEALPPLDVQRSVLRVRPEDSVYRCFPPPGPREEARPVLLAEAPQMTTRLMVLASLIKKWGTSKIAHQSEGSSVSMEDKE